MAEQKYLWKDNPTASGVAICNTDVLNDCLMHLKYDNNSTGYEVGDLVYRMLPTIDASKHLMDGTLFDGNGIFKDFVEYIANLYKTNPLAGYFTNESDWQATVEQYGVCGKFVYDTVANTVRLPKVTGHIEGTLDANALGDLVEAGLPNITGTLGNVCLNAANSSGAISITHLAAASMSGNDHAQYRANLNASNSSPIYKDDVTTVQTQSLLGYMYIVVATGTKTAVDLEIDNIVTDLNNKVDISNMVEVPTIVEVSDKSLMPSWYIVYSNGWCEQGGIGTATKATSETQTITLLKAYKDTNYSIQISALLTADNITQLYFQTVSKNTNNFKAKSTYSGNAYNGTVSPNWYACGYIA